MLPEASSPKAGQISLVEQIGLAGCQQVNR
jgi:hypothetical protein